MGWVTTDKGFLVVRGLNFTKLGEDLGRSWLHKKFISEFAYLAAFSNASGSKLNDSRVMLKTTPNFALFDPVKIRGWVGEISIPIVEALPTTEPPEYI